MTYDKYRPAHPEMSQIKVGNINIGWIDYKKGLWYGPANLEKMYNLSDKIIEFIYNVRENRQMQRIARE